MDLGLQGRVAMVLASSKGLGRAIALGFAREGARVTICARGQEALDETKRQIEDETGVGILALTLDVSLRESHTKLVEETLSRFGQIDVLVNNSGGPPAGNPLTLPDSSWQEALDLNLLSTVFMTKEVIPHMMPRRWGRVINLTSYSVKQPVDSLVLSNMARAGVVGFAKTLASELAPHNITVNNICPGVFSTDRHHELARGRAQKLGIDLEEYLAQQASSIPVKRFGEPAELADLVVFLSSERASYITGTTLQIDGGLVRGLL